METFSERTVSANVTPTIPCQDPADPGAEGASRLLDAFRFFGSAGLDEVRRFRPDVEQHDLPLPAAQDRCAW